MNRRQMLTNVATGVGALVVTGSNQRDTEGCESVQKVEPNRDTYCPLYPLLFFGTYTGYFAMKFDGTNCFPPFKNLSGPNNLPIGCNNGGCVSRGKVDPAERKNDLSEKGCGKHPTGLCAAPGVTIAEQDEVVFKGLHPKTGKEFDIHARIFEINVSIKDFDRTHLSADTAKLLDAHSAAVGPFYVGHQIPGNAAPKGKFGVQTGATTSIRQSHVYQIQMKKGANTKDFEVVIATTN